MMIYGPDGVSYTQSNGVLIVSVQTELYGDMVLQLQKSILEHVYKEQLRGVLIDVSGVDILDSFAVRILIDIYKSVKLLGAKTLYTGMRPEVVASIIDLGIVVNEFMVVRDLDEGFHVLNTLRDTST